MSANSFGKKLSITTFGESHGKAIGVVVDGCPSGIEISENYIQNIVNERRPSQSKYTSQRKEDDKIEILSGIYKGKTLGTPISIIIENKDAKSEDYDNLISTFRPSHADYTWHYKYLHRDHRGGGRSSARETLARVVGSAIAYKILEIHNIAVIGFISSIYGKEINYNNLNYNEINKNPLFCPDQEVIKEWESILDNTMLEGDSVGGTIDIHIKNMPRGLGEPIFEKLNAQIAKAIFSIPAVKGLEFGTGFAITKMKGSQANDSMSYENENIKFNSNNHGGTLGGISTGEDIILKIAIKPTSSISIEQNTINSQLENIKIKIKGRHDPCIAIRAVPVCKSMCALTIADLLLQTISLN